MIAIEPLELHNDVRCGVTMVDTSHLPWPGSTFSEGSSATPEHVAESYRLLAHELDVDRSRIKGVRQVHGTGIAINPDQEVEGDAIISDDTDTVVGVKIADCLAVLIYDPTHHVIAAVHSGWRGTAQDIAGRTVRTLCERFDSDPSSLLVALSPSASGRNYEVGEDVQAVLSAWCTPRPELSGRWLFDNQRAVIDQLEKTGIPRGNITPSDICTMEDRRFHSHRRDRERAGRCFAFLQMR